MYSLYEGYSYMIDYLDNYYEETHEDEVQAYLSDLDFYDDDLENPQTMDPAAWEDWEYAVKNLVDSNHMLSIENVYQGMINQLTDYNARISYEESIKVLITHIKEEKKHLSEKEE